MNQKEIELLEAKYLNKYYYFLKFAIDEILVGLLTREKIKSDWSGLYGTKISDYATGAERVIYSLLNGKGIGVPNSAPVGSDLFFEVDDAFIHIDLKTVGASLKNSCNIGDFKEDIFVGTNQNSYKSNILINEGKPNQIARPYLPHLPPIYNSGNNKKSKPCLTYFITMLYDKDTLDTLVINIMCMPNGMLESIYKHEPLKAGKLKDKTRFRFSRTEDFRLLKDEKRIKLVYFKDDMHPTYTKKLKFQHKIYKTQIV
ncbi:hypothetical protein N9H92_01055 [Gammaproteobacteria bacterium]|nr:hypothetical protein [Gammaproteobacteria bacterium]